MTVSWDDVCKDDGFLIRLARRLANSQVFLPTEAQWEYACRAGTNSAYSFGESLDSAQANLSSRSTVSVIALPRNSWGLYQMHGNLWEWCADRPRTFAAEPAVNPDGGQDGGTRVLRGGAWNSTAGDARSAYRSDGLRVSRSLSFGFRFALTSIEPGAGGGNQTGAEAGGDR